MKMRILGWHDLCNRISAGKSLTPDERQFVVGILDLVRRGEDPREFAGTKRGKGRRRAVHLVPALHYRMLRGRGDTDKAAMPEVRKAWGISETTLRDAIRQSAILEVEYDAEALAKFEREAKSRK